MASSLASILNATTPLFAVLAAHVLTPLKAAGVAVGFAGAVVIIGPGASAGLDTGVLAQLADGRLPRLLSLMRTGWPAARPGPTR